MPIRCPVMKHAIEIGLIPEDIAQEFDDWSDELAHRITRGELTNEEGNALTMTRALEDAGRAAARGYPKGQAAELVAKEGRGLGEVTKGQRVFLVWPGAVPHGLPMPTGGRFPGVVEDVISREDMTRLFRVSQGAIIDAKQYATFTVEHPFGGVPALVGLALQDDGWRLGAEPTGPVITIEERPSIWSVENRHDQS